MIGFVLTEVERILKKYQTRDSYELLDAIGAVTVFSNAYKSEGLKGYCTIMNRTMYAVINDKLNEYDKRIAAGHEAAHLLLHRDEILRSPVKAMRDFNLLDNSGHYEREANAFLADFLLSDEDVLSAIEGDETDFFSTARILCIPAPLLAFKAYNMIKRGHRIQSPIDLDSRFLGR